MTQIHKYLKWGKHNLIKKYMISPYAVALIDENTENIIWANAEAAKLLNANPNGQNTQNIKPIQQIKAACKKTKDENKQNAFLKSPTQFIAKSIGFEINKINIYNQNAFLFISQRMKHKGCKINQMAEDFVEVLSENDIAAAVLDCQWKMIAGEKNIKEDEIKKIMWKVKHENIAEGEIKIKGQNKHAVVSEINNMYIVIVPDCSTAEKEKEIFVNKEIESKQIINSNKDASVRTFSAKTENVGENKMGRWYYKNIEAENTEGNIEENIKAEKIENVESKSNGELSESERLRFNEIGEKLSGKLRGKNKEKNTEKKIEQEGNKEGFVPAAFSVVKKIEEEIDTSVLTKLPVPVLIYKENKLLFVNHEFLKITGYESLEEIIKCGGSYTLFGKTKLNTLLGKIKLAKNTNEENKIVHSNGHILNVVAKIQCVPWENTKAIMMTLRQKYEKNKNGETH